MNVPWWVVGWGCKRAGCGGVGGGVATEGRKLPTASYIWGGEGSVPARSRVCGSFGEKPATMWQ